MSRTPNRGGWDLRPFTIHAFWERIDVRCLDECWPWTGATDRDGYGVFGHKRRQVRASRAAWELTYWSVPEGLFVLHRCDNPPCCNPLHLFLGTVADNNRDRDAKGRNATGGRSGPRTKPESYPRGESHPCAKFTDAEVAEIRAAFLAHVEPRAALAERYGISRAHLRRIGKGLDRLVGSVR